MRVTDIVKALKGVKSTDEVLDAGCGPGWVSIALSPFVNKIVMFDFSDEMVKRVNENIQHFNNLSVHQCDIEDISVIKNLGVTFDKVIVGSVLQYLSSYKSIEEIMENVFTVMADKGICVFTSNPDFRKKNKHIKSYEELDWDKDKIKKVLEKEEKRFWIDFDKIKDIAIKAGFSECRETPINPALFQSRHMFDFVVEK